jgi:hypothetical protein
MGLQIDEGEPLKNVSETLFAKRITIAGRCSPALLGRSKLQRATRRKWQAGQTTHIQLRMKAHKVVWD